MSDFYPGQHVLCVDDSGIPPFMGELHKGTVYTVRHLDIENGPPGIELEEIRNPIHQPSGEEYGYQTWRFRPLKDSALDVFRAHLEPAPKQKEPAQ